GHADTRTELKRETHRKLLEALPADRVAKLGEANLRAELKRAALELAERGHDALDHLEQEGLVDQVVDELVGFGPLGPLSRATGISEILVNGPHQVFVERAGQLSSANVTFRDEEHLMQVVRRMVSHSGRRIDKKTPLVDARLPDGSRLNAVL